MSKNRWSDKRPMREECFGEYEQNKEKCLWCRVEWLKLCVTWARNPFNLRRMKAKKLMDWGSLAIVLGVTFWNLINRAFLGAVVQVCMSGVLIWFKIRAYREIWEIKRKAQALKWGIKK